MKNLMKSRGGFTLIEILVVIGIIAILAAVVLVAINPARQFAQARDSQRNSNLNAILNAIGQRMADNKGVFAGTYTIGTGAAMQTYHCGPLPTNGPDGTEITITAPNALPALPTGDLGCLIPTYMSDFPYDPSQPAPTAGDPGIGYNVFADAGGRVHVLAPVLEPAVTRDDAMEIVR